MTRETRADALSGTLAFCWSHLRRQFVKIEREAAPAPAPVAREALERIAQLYAVEKVLRGRSADERYAGRQAHARPLAAASKQWFEAKLDHLAQKSDTAKALRYALRHWEGLTLYLDDGRIEMDTNAVERAMRPIKLNAKNSLFAGCDEGAENWALLASLIETALCRTRHRQIYAARRTMPNGFWSGTPLSRWHRRSRAGQPHSIRHSLVVQSASRKASRRSFGWKRARLPRSYGLSFARQLP